MSNALRIVLAVLKTDLLRKENREKRTREEKRARKSA